ncbi:MAG TPA: hypothetical protein DHW82_11920 [Spirochaetia bacterium]|nr:MAG: hypothetical protein A2Y41_12460 [Spirochaetes bacterium GWB1_36_13]HCL57698.1 hypothetical protein [Spirochaetia bacterium]
MNRNSIVSLFLLTFLFLFTGILSAAAFEPFPLFENKEVLVFIENNGFTDKGFGEDISDKGAEIILDMILQEGDLKETKKEDLIKVVREAFLKQNYCAIVIKEKNKGLIGYLHPFKDNGFSVTATVIENKVAHRAIYGFTMNKEGIITHIFK